MSLDDHSRSKRSDSGWGSAVSAPKSGC